MSTAAQAGTDDPGKESLARSSALMASGTLVSRLLGFVRTFTQGAAIGVTTEVGAQVFDIANKLPNIFYMLLAGGVLNAVLVPQIVRALRRADGGVDFVNRLVTLALLVMGATTVVLTLAAPLVVRAFTDGWPAAWLTLATVMAFWCLPQVFFYGLYTVLGQVLNAKGSFGPYMWAPVLNNVIAIVGLVVFVVAFPGVKGFAAGEFTPGMVALLAGSSTLGIVAQALVLFWPLRKAGFRYRPTFGFRGLGFRTAGRVAMWTFAGIVAGQLVFLVTTRVMSRAGAELSDAGVVGATNASYTPAYLLFMLPHSIVAVSLVTALFTRLSASAAAGDVAAVRRDFSSGARTVIVAGVLATVAFCVLGTLIGAALFSNGRFIGQVLVAMSIGLVPFSVNYLVQRVFYAYEDARTVFVVAVVTAVVMAAGNVVNVLLVPAQWAVVAVGLSMSASNVVGVLLALVLLRRKLRALDGHGIDGHLVLRTLVRVVVVGAVSGGLTYGLVRLAEPLGDGRLVSLAIVVVGGVVLLAVFVVLCHLMRVRELEELAVPLLRRLPGGRRLVRR